MHTNFKFYPVQYLSRDQVVDPVYSVVTSYEHLTLMSVGFPQFGAMTSPHIVSHFITAMHVEPDRGTKDVPAFYKLYPRPHSGSTIFLRSGIRAWGRGYTSWLHFGIGRCMGQHLVHSKVWPSQFPIPSCHLARYLIRPSLSLVLLFTVWTQSSRGLSQCFYEPKCQDKFSTVVREIDVVCRA